MRGEVRATPSASRPDRDQVLPQARSGGEPQVADAGHAHWSGPSPQLRKGQHKVRVRGLPSTSDGTRNPSGQSPSAARSPTASTPTTLNNSIFGEVAHEDARRENVLCRQTDSELFFPGVGASTADVRKVCGFCEVCEACTDCAITTGVRHGI